MQVTGVFVGINKHLSPDVTNLTGAVRDAQALWSLFSDTFSDMKSSLLTDHDAHVEAVRDRIAEALELAIEDSLVIISFSGHGTRSHRLVGHDTERERLDFTTISMEYLADHFKRSKAKTIVCILDCCFSGGAPAKVFDDSPSTRDFDDPYALLSGKGRILIAASTASQPAYEQPGIGHGLLTEAIIRILTKGEESTNLPLAVNEITEIVQAEAAKLGVIQTPVILSFIEGEFKIPVLRQGKNYLSFFPPERSISVTRLLSDLEQFGLPESVIEGWQARFKEGLNDLQIEAVNTYKVLSSESLLVVAPTSSGKTFVGEMAAVKAVSEGKKAVFLLPYRALVNEKYEDFEHYYGAQLGMSVIRLTGDYSDQTNDFLRGKYDLAVLTFEMFLNITTATPAVLNQLGLVVLDEAQFITDPSRGITVELILTCILSARQRGINPQILALSAVIGRVNHFDHWLKVRLLLTTKRPVPLIEGVMDRTGQYQFLDTDGSVKVEQIVPFSNIVMRKNKPETQDMIVPLVSKLLINDERVIVFRNMRGKAQGCAAYLSKSLGLDPARDCGEKLPHLDQSSSSQSLRQCLLGGTAFHTANLSRDEREVVEREFKNPFGEIKVLAATTTVAAGINTPASTVIIAEQEFIGEDGREFTVAEYKNMAGRAGRQGYNETGRSIILAETKMKRSQLFQKYVMGKVENISSSFNQGSLNTWVIRLLAQVRSVEKKQIASLLVNTYGGYLATVNDASWPKKIGLTLSNLIERMLSNGLLEEEEDRISLTLLGKACGNSSLSFESSLRLVALVRAYSADALGPEEFMVMVQILEESDASYTPLNKKKNGEPKRILQASQRLGSQLTISLQKFASDQFIHQSRCKRASILFDWVNGSPVEHIEREFSFSPYAGAISAGDVRKFADNTRYHLRSAYQIAMIVSPDMAAKEEDFDRLLRRLEVGLPVHALDLLELPFRLTRGEYLTLLVNKIMTVEDFWRLSSKQHQDMMGEARERYFAGFRPKDR